MGAHNAILARAMDEIRDKYQQNPLMVMADEKEHPEWACPVCALAWCHDETTSVARPTNGRRSCPRTTPTTASATATATAARFRTASRRGRRVRWLRFFRRCRCRSYHRRTGLHVQDCPRG